MVKNLCIATDVHIMIPRKFSDIVTIDITHLTVRNTRRKIQIQVIKVIKSETTVTQKKQEALNYIQTFHVVILIYFAYVMWSRISICIGYIRFEQSNIGYEFCSHLQPPPFFTSLCHKIANKSRREPCVFNEIVLCTMKSSQARMKSSACRLR